MGEPTRLKLPYLGGLFRRFSTFGILSRVRNVCLLLSHSVTCHKIHYNSFVSDKLHQEKPSDLSTNFAFKSLLRHFRVYVLAPSYLVVIAWEFLIPLMPDGKAVYGNVRKGVLLIASLLCTIPSGLFAWEGVIVHHTASKNLSVAHCDEIHRARGWESCGYNYLIQPDGRVDRARGERIGAHCKGYNSKYLGVAVVTDDTPTQAQVLTLKRFILVRGLPYYPHSSFRATECPGKVLEEIK